MSLSTRRIRALAGLHEAQMTMTKGIKISDLPDFDAAEYLNSKEGF